MGGPGDHGAQLGAEELGHGDDELGGPVPGNHALPSEQTSLRLDHFFLFVLDIIITNSPLILSNYHGENDLCIVLEYLLSIKVFGWVDYW